MPFPTTEEHVRRAEEALGMTLPALYRARLFRKNGGDVEAADDVWQLFPVQDTSDRKRLSRTANHLVREATEARKWPQFPPTAIAIAANGTGDYLILRTVEGRSTATDDLVLLWHHEDGTTTPVDVTWDP